MIIKVTDLPLFFRVLHGKMSHLLEIESFSIQCSVFTLMFQEFFENPAFRADGLKIYPTLVIRGTGLYELWKTGR